MKAFDTDIKPFDNSYKTNDILQKDFNTLTIENYTDIIYMFYTSLGEKKHPIAIVDLCCGYGKPTFDLFNNLLERDVDIEKVIGYDISEDMIKSAQEEYKELSPKLNFKQQDVENLTDKAEYDVVISLFGFHWMNNIQEVASRIFESLKIPGKLMFFVPLEKMDLYSFREKFVNDSSWSECFKNMNHLKPFVENKEDYLDAFSQFFECEKEEAKTVIKHYTEPQFIQFLSSWVQEVRHLCSEQKYPIIKKIISQSYVKELIDSIPELDSGNVIKINDNIIFTEHIFSYEGQKNSEIMGDILFE